VIDVTFLGLHVTSTLVGVFLLNVLLAYSAYPVYALGRMNMSFIAFAGVGGYAAAILQQRYGVAPGLAIVLAAALSASAAVPIGALLGRVRGVYLAIATVNLVGAFQIAAQNLESLTGGATGLLGLPVVSTPEIIGVATLAVVVLFWLFSRSRTGHAVRIQRRDPLLAESVGVNTNMNVSALFVASAALAGLQGGLTVFWYGFVNPDAYSFQVLVLVVAMVVVGGTGHWLGPLVGAAFFTILPEWFRFAGVMTDVFVGCVLLLVVLFFQEGIVGTISRQASVLRARGTAEARARSA
jgi:branched-chain amino acid transport system permease protein